MPFYAHPRPTSSDHSSDFTCSRWSSHLRWTPSEAWSPDTAIVRYAAQTEEQPDSETEGQSADRVRLIDVREFTVKRVRRFRYVDE